MSSAADTSHFHIDLPPTHTQSARRAWVQILHSVFETFFFWHFFCISVWCYDGWQPLSRNVRISFPLVLLTTTATSVPLVVAHHLALCFLLLFSSLFFWCQFALGKYLGQDAVKWMHFNGTQQKRENVVSVAGESRKMSQVRLWSCPKIWGEWLEIRASPFTASAIWIYSERRWAPFAHFECILWENSRK